MGAFTKKFSEMPEKSGRRPENKGGSKIEKRSFFGIKNVKIFKSGTQFFFLKKKFNPTMLPKRHFALKDTFPMETMVNKKTAKIPKISKISKILLCYFSKKKSKKNKIGKKIIYFFLGACGASASFFFSAPAAPLFFSFFQ